MRRFKITLLTSIGSGIEYYDLVIYSLLAKFISQQFFPGDNQVAQLFATFGVLALGQLARILGGTLFGVLGDRFGRKYIFSNLLLWVSLMTFLMGLVPSFHSMGIGATLLFSLCRILQCFFYSAELPGAMTMLTEYIDQKKHGLHFGCMVAAKGVGVAFAAWVIGLLTSLLSPEQMSVWGFRIPFLLGGVFAGIGFYIRKVLPETPVFLAMKPAGVKLDKEVIKQQLRPIITIMGIMLLPTSILTFDLIFPVYLNSVYHFDLTDVYFWASYGALWSVILVPTLGFISDYMGRKKLFIITVSVMLATIFPVFSLLNTGSKSSLILYIFFIQTIKSGLSASYIALIPRAFDAATRYSGVSIGYNLSWSLAAMVPLLANYLYGVLGRTDHIIWLFVILAMVGTFSVIGLEYKPIAPEQSAIARSERSE